MNLPNLYKTFVQSLSADAVLENAKKLWEWNRWSNFKNYNDAAEHILQCFNEYGVQSECVDLPADGKSGFGDAIMPLAWNCQEAVVEVVSPMPIVLCRREETPLCIGMWSPPTGEEGIEADLIVVDDPARLETMDVKGKWILTQGRFQDVRRAAAKGEAVGVLSGWLPNESRSDTQWIGSNTDLSGGWGTRENEKPVIAIAIKPTQAEDLKTMSDGQTVRIKAVIKSELSAGILPFIHASIPGEPGEQEVLVITPLFGPGANYNAVGAASLLEACRLLQSKIEKNVLPRPKRTIRFLFAPKLYGSIAFAHDGKVHLQKTLCALCLETGAGNPDRAWCRWTLHPTTSAQRHFVNGLVWNICRNYLQEWRPQRFMEKRPFSLLADVFFNDPAIGVPTAWLHGGTEAECKYTSADILDAVDRRSCIDLTAAAASVLYLAASAGAADMPHLAYWNYAFSQEIFQEDVQYFLDRAAKADGLADIKEILTEAMRHFPLRTSLESKGLQSLERLVKDAASAPEWDSVHELLGSLNDLGDSALALIRARLEARGAEMGKEASDIQPLEKTVEDERKPKRVEGVIGTIMLDPLPYDQWTTPIKRSPRCNLPFILAWWLADGERTIAEIERLVHLDARGYRECIPAWFTFLEKAGYVKFGVGEG
ncbi:MAG: M28 family peptidase [Candidatus Omnitrophota bacterium]